jgi:hypothetical protein
LPLKISVGFPEALTDALSVPTIFVVDDVELDAELFAPLDVLLPEPPLNDDDPTALGAPDAVALAEAVNVTADEAPMFTS